MQNIQPRNMLLNMMTEAKYICLDGVCHTLAAVCRKTQRQLYLMNASFGCMDNTQSSVRSILLSQQTILFKTQSSLYYSSSVRVCVCVCVFFALHFII